MEIFIKCKVENCENTKIKARGYCNRHYGQLCKYNKILKRTPYDLNEIIDCGDYYEICLYNRKCKEIARTKIDKEDLKKVKKYKWSLLNIGYAVAKINDKTVLLHHLIFGNPPTGYEVDHWDTNRLNNRKYNLRFATRSQNMMNRKLQTNNKSGYSGVYFNYSANKWISQIKINNKTIYLNLFFDKKDAIKARQEAEQKYFKEFSHKK